MGRKTFSKMAVHELAWVALAWTAVRLSKRAWRHRAGLLPFWWCAVFLTGGWVAATFWPTRWPVPVSAGCVVAAGLWFFGARMSPHAQRMWMWLVPDSLDDGKPGVLDRNTERGYLAILLIGGGSWLSARMQYGWTSTVQLALLALLLVLGAPWWWHRGWRRKKPLNIWARRWSRVEGNEDLRPWHGSSVVRAASVPNATLLVVRLRGGRTVLHIGGDALTLCSQLGLRPGAITVAQDPDSARRVLVRVVPRDPWTAPILHPMPALRSLSLDETPMVPVGRYEDGSEDLHKLECHRLLCGSTGCIAAETRIFLPLTGEHVRVEELARRGEPISVSAWTPWGMTVARTKGAPFLKGYAELYEVRCSGGATLRVTSEHRFLTPQGWKRAGDMHAGQLLAAAPHAEFASSVAVPRGSPSDGHRCSQTGEGSLDDCLTYRHLCDPLLRPLRVDDLSGTPSQACGHARTLHCLHLGAPACGPGCIHACRRCSHRPTIHASHLRKSLDVSAGRPASALSIRNWRTFLGAPRPLPLRARTDTACTPLLPHLRFWRISLARLRYGPGPKARRNGISPRLLWLKPLCRFQWLRPIPRPGNADELLLPRSAKVGTVRLPRGWELRDRPVFRGPWHGSYRSASPGESVQNPTDTASQSVPHPCHHSIRWDTIRTIRRAGPGEFYDLTVPGPANYVAEGLVHHNSGKSAWMQSLVCWMLAYQNSVIVAADLAGGATLDLWEDALAAPLATGIPEAFELLQQVFRLIEYRERLLTARRRAGERIDVLPVSPENPAVFVIIDEFPDLVNGAKVEVGGNGERYDVLTVLERIAKKARKVRIWLTLAAQNPTKDDVGSTTLRAQLTATVGLSLDQQQSKNLWQSLRSQGWDSEPLSVGTYLLRDRNDKEHQQPRVAKGLWLSPDSRAALIEKASRQPGMFTGKEAQIVAGPDRRIISADPLPELAGGMPVEKPQLRVVRETPEPSSGNLGGTLLRSRSAVLDEKVFDEIPDSRQGGVGQKEIAVQLGVSPDQSKRSLKRLADRGLVRSNGDGTWSRR